MSRLTILLDKGLSSGQKMAQAVHATAEYQLRGSETWKNDTVVILDIDPDGILQVISRGAIEYVDPYYGYPRAAAFVDLDFDTSSLPLSK